MSPQVKAVLHTLPQDRRQRSSFKGIILFAFCLSAWTMSQTFIFAAPMWLSMTASVAGGFAISMLFIVGHDACHGSLIDSRSMNRIIGTLAFLPALHPFSSWRKNHNGMHHVWTNLKQQDPGYAPWSFEEFQQLSLPRRVMERVYRTRTTAGLGLFYFVEIWLRYQLFPSRAHRPSNRREFHLDRLLVTAFLLVQCAVIYTMAEFANRSSPTLFTVCVLAIQYGVFFSLMGFVTFQHHTHPDIPWFDQRDEWSYFQGQVSGTTHIQFPKFCDIILLNILEHSAHHVDPLIPLYRLPQSQTALEDAYPGAIKIIVWNPLVLWNTLSCCKLYDYQSHCWLDFAGKPTTPRHLIVKSAPKSSTKDLNIPTAGLVSRVLLPNGLEDISERTTVSGSL